MKYNSQLGQDAIVNSILRGMTGGFFVEIGAFDGVEGSNTLVFEHELGWTGICIEPNPHSFAKLKANRKCECANVALSSETGQASFMIGGTAVETLSHLSQYANTEHLKKFGGEYSETHVDQIHAGEFFVSRGVRKIDYLSIDTEGNEKEIIKAFDWQSVDVTVVSIENNDHDRSMAEMMADRGFLRLCILQWDEIYLKIIK